MQIRALEYFHEEINNHIFKRTEYYLHKGFISVLPSITKLLIICTSSGSFVSWLNLIRHEGHEPILRVTAWNSPSNRVKKTIESQWQLMLLPAIGTRRNYRNGHQVLSFSKKRSQGTQKSLIKTTYFFFQRSSICNLV